MLHEAHKALEAMSAGCASIKDEQWAEAERALHQVQDMVGRLLRELGERMRAPLQPPVLDKRDHD